MTTLKCIVNMKIRKMPMQCRGDLRKYRGVPTRIKKKQRRGGIFRPFLQVLEV